MSTSVRKPLARSQDLVIEELEDELLVYDRANNRAHCLGATAAAVWRACDGTSDVQSLSVELGLSSDLVTDAVDELERLQLLDGLHLIDGAAKGNGSGLTRREITLRSMQAGGAIAAAPMIYSIVVPTAAAAATPTPFQCQLYSVDGCGNCKDIAGCCCCDVSCGGECKPCSSINFCKAGKQQCLGKAGNATGCSDTGAPTGQAEPGGCCSVSFPAPRGCGCAFGSKAGCCDATSTAAKPKVCTSATNCVPCCNGVPITSTFPLQSCN